MPVRCYRDLYAEGIHFILNQIKYKLKTEICIPLKILRVLSYMLLQDLQCIKMASYHFGLLKCISTEHEYAEYSDRFYINCTKKIVGKCILEYL